MPREKGVRSTPGKGKKNDRFNGPNDDKWMGMLMGRKETGSSLRPSSVPQPARDIS